MKNIINTDFNDFKSLKNYSSNTIQETELENTFPLQIRKEIESKENNTVDNVLRPKLLSEYIGKSDLKRELSVYINAAKNIKNHFCSLNRKKRRVNRYTNFFA